MTFASLFRGWNDFFFKPQRPTPVALYRIVYGALNVLSVWLSRPGWLDWYGPHSVVSLQTAHRLANGPRIDVIAILPQTDAAMYAFFWVYLVLAICLTLGFMTRLSLVLVYICLSSVHVRDIYILNSGDSLMRVTGFFLMFAPAGAAFSIDRLWRVWRGKEGPDIPLKSPWAQRMIQIEMSLVYISTAWWKSLGRLWINGTAVYYSMQLYDFKRFPVPGLYSPLFMKLAAWGTLVVEFSAGILVWFRDLRYYVLLAALLLHAGIEYAMVIPLFEWIMVGTFVTFIYPEDLTRAWAYIRRRVGPWFGSPITVLYDPASAPSLHAADLVRAIDVFGRLQLIDLHSAEAAIFPDATSRWTSQSRILVATRAGFRGGFPGLRAIAPRVPLLWPLAPLSWFAGDSRRVSSAPSAT